MTVAATYHTARRHGARAAATGRTVGRRTSRELRSLSGPSPSLVGIAVGALGLVLLYVLLTTSGAAHVVGAATRWVARFASPAYPLI